MNQGPYWGIEFQTSSDGIFPGRTCGAGKRISFFVPDTFFVEMSSIVKTMLLQSPFNKRQQVGVDRVCLRGGHPVREILVGLQCPVL